MSPELRIASKQGSSRPRFAYAAIALFMMLALQPVFTTASDDEYLRSLQDDFLSDQSDGDSNNTVDGCVPNENASGVVCDNITLHEAQLIGSNLRVRLDLNSTFDYPQSTLFFTTARVYVTYYNVTEVEILNFTFNSETPDGTVLAEGETNMGDVDLKTGNIFFPEIATNIRISHNVTLLRPPTPADTDSSNSSESFVCPLSSTPPVYCESGTIQAVLGLFGDGTKSSPAVRIEILTEEPEATQISVPFRHFVNATDFCENLAQTTVYNRNMTARIEVCVPGFPCFHDDRKINVDNLDDSATLEDDCFQHSFVLP